MAPNKFEDDFKEKLEKREITFSSEAWTKLSKRLDEVEHSSNKNNKYWWLAIAASIIGVVFVVSQFLKTNTNVEIPVIVDTPKKVVIPETIANIEQQAIIDTLIIAIEKVAPKNISKKEKIIEASVNKELEIIESQPKIAVAKENKRIKKEITGQEEEKQAVAFENEKANELADAIFKMSETTSGISNTDIDSLLKQAQREILLNRMKNEDKLAVDAAILLQEVEYELDTSFRDKVFKALKNGYGSVKIAIVQRND